MVKLFILSDTHKNIAQIQKLSHIMSESDYVLHLGDFVSDMDSFKTLLGEKLITVNGNCDFFVNGSTERVLQIADIKVFCCHGHKYGVKTGLSKLKVRALDLGCNLALFGHTHRALVQQGDDITIINPGCMTSCSTEKSYAYVTIEGNKIFGKIVKI